MKITLEIPDTTGCAFFNYVFYTNTGMSMVSRQIDTDDLQRGGVIDCNSTEKGGEADA